MSPPSPPSPGHPRPTGRGTAAQAHTQGTEGSKRAARGPAVRGQALTCSRCSASADFNHLVRPSSDCPPLARDSRCLPPLPHAHFMSSYCVPGTRLYPARQPREVQPVSSQAMDGAPEAQPLWRRAQTFVSGDLSPAGCGGQREREGEDVAEQARGGARVTTVRARRCPARQAVGAGLALLACGAGAGRAGWLDHITARDAPGGHRDHPFCSTGWTTYSTWPTESRGNSAPTPLPPAPRCPSLDPCPDGHLSTSPPGLPA